MKIALVITLGGDLVRSTEHLGIGYIAAVLRANSYHVDIYEISEVDIAYRDRYQSLLDNNYDLIGFTTTCVIMKNINKLCQIVKEQSGNSKIVYGGHMATFTEQELLKKFEYIDFSIIGEGEYTFLELVRCMEHNGDYSQIKGLIFRDNNEIIVNEPRELISDLDELPFPARDQFEQHGGRVQYIRLSTSRGCLGRCAFCSNFAGRNQKGHVWRGRSPVNVVDEIEDLIKKYNFKTYDFVDSTFEDPGRIGKQRIKEIAQEIIKRKLDIYYNCCCRAENWSIEDDDLLGLLVESGLEKVNIGFEAGNNKGLKILNKRATVEDNFRAIEILNRHKEIYLTFGFIMLHPYSTIEDMRDNAKFLHDTGFGQVIRHYFWRLEVYPGTLMEKKLIEDQLLDKAYDIDDGMYKYHYINDSVIQFEPIFEEMLSIQSVWDFEIFDILIHTFIIRLLRKYKNDVIFKDLEAFSSYVTKVRLEMTDYNYNFFEEILNLKSSYDVGKGKKVIDNYIKQRMSDIKRQQYILGLKLKRNGYILDIK